MNYTKLDKAFSDYIRKRDSNEYGRVCCITCGHFINTEDSECGHYIGRRNKAVRFDEVNCNAQCHECNSKDDKKLYREMLISKYGLDEVEALEQRAVKHKHWTQWEIDELTKKYLH